MITARAKSLHCPLTVVTLLVTTNVSHQEIWRVGPTRTNVDFSAPEPICAKAELRNVEKRVNELIDNGRLFRYQGVEDVALLEKYTTQWATSTMTCLGNALVDIAVSVTEDRGGNSKL